MNLPTEMRAFELEQELQLRIAENIISGTCQLSHLPLAIPVKGVVQDHPSGLLAAFFLSVDSCTDRRVTQTMAFSGLFHSKGRSSMEYIHSLATENSTEIIRRGFATAYPISQGGDTLAYRLFCDCQDLFDFAVDNSCHKLWSN